MPGLEEAVNTHFIAFTHVDGSLYELDGRKDTPVNHGPTTGDTLLEVGRSAPPLPYACRGPRMPASPPPLAPQDACKVIKGFMARDEGEMRFTIVAVAAKEE